MPFELLDFDCDPLLIDFEYKITDKDLLANYVGEMVLGHHDHLLKIINNIAATFPVHRNQSIDQAISKIKSATIAHRDGWLFQMISWVVLAKRNVGHPFHVNMPHFAPAQHGIDGLAIRLNSDGSLRSIIITEDKCTTNPRGKITDQVFPDFKEFENGAKDAAMIGIVSTLLKNSPNAVESVQNDVFDPSFRLYRIGITRQDSHNSKEGRNKLFKDYDKIVQDAKPARRSAASIYIKDLRPWMDDFATKVIAFLESKKS